MKDMPSAAEMERARALNDQESARLTQYVQLMGQQAVYDLLARFCPCENCNPTKQLANLHPVEARLIILAAVVGISRVGLDHYDAMKESQK